MSERRKRKTTRGITARKLRKTAIVLACLGGALLLVGLIVALLSRCPYFFFN